MRFVVYTVMTCRFTATSTSAKIAMALSQCFFVITFGTGPLIWTVDFFYFFSENKNQHQGIWYTYGILDISFSSNLN